MKDDHHEPSDEHLAMLVQQGDKEKFGVLMERYEKKLFRYGRKFLSNKDNIEDVVQEVFIKTYQSIKSFDTSQRFSPWIYRIAHNTFINEIRRHSRTPISFFDFDTLVAHPIYDDPGLAEAEQKEMQKMLEKGLDKLQPQYREILILFYLEELSYKEIADILRIPVGTVGIRLKRAKEKLVKVYESLGITYGQ
ncbi:MAG: polymerase sigma factor SigW, polymerase sigma-70 factor, subfamily [Candidatus Paceibacter sp.]|jgi:RNA polymerase sigma-70 factor (ECF subfamily)|nr:polymerase sigma factor SigW, polymerase sigma-70 factor, subfamily [Candidatus Paceibacter sp.]